MSVAALYSQLRASTRNTVIGNVADWHATMGLKAYRKRDYPTYTRHIRIADNLRKTS